MKQVININFQGRVVPIETTAFEILKNYTDSLNRHFINEEGKEEIINDIESRIGELFQERIKKGATCITEDDVNAIINSIGRPEDFEPMDDDGSQKKSSSAFDSNQQQQTFTSSSNAGNKRLYRNENDKVLGGVCSGLANYFNIDVVVVRIIFAILFFTFGFGFLPYIIMWVAVPSSSSLQIGGAKKKLFRDPDDKLIAGVCSGIGNYFGINAWIPRALFLLPFLSFLSRWGHWGGFWGVGDVIRFTFSPTSLIVYIILWIVIPEAFTTSEKLEMKGEKVDMNSIKNSVMEEMKTVSKKAEKFGSEASGVISEKAKVVAADVQGFSRRRGGFGNIIAMIAKIFAYFIIGCVVFGLVVALFALAVSAIGVFPLKDFVLKGGWQNLFAWGTLVLFIAVPIIGIITWLIRRIGKMRNNSRILNLTFGSLWTLGWVCIIMLIASVTRDFSTGSRLEETAVVLSNPNVNKLVVSSANPFNKKYYGRNWIRLEPFENENILGEDTAYVRNIYVEIVKSATDSFRVTMKKTARGNTRAVANNLASLIEFGVKQNDTLLQLEKGIAINKTDKFRNQAVIITIYVPVGKQIRINRGIGWPVHFGNGKWERDWDNDFYDWDDEENMRWQSDVDYLMKEDGLYTLTGKKADGWNDKKNSNKNNNRNNNDNNDSYRYNENEFDKKADSVRKIQEQKRQLKLDSLEREEKRIERVKDSLENISTEIGSVETISAGLIPALTVWGSI